MPRPATVLEEQQGAAAIPSDAVVFQRPNIQSIRMRVPICKALVIYMGNRDNRSVAMQGHLVRKNRGGKVMVSLSSAGIESYDFSRYDADGEYITARMVPDAYPPDVRGKPSLRIDHAEHLRLFARMRDKTGAFEFSVRVHPDDREAFEDYVRRKEASLQSNDRNVTEIAA